MERNVRLPRRLIEEETRELVAEICRQVHTLLRDNGVEPHAVGALVLAGNAGAFPPLVESIGQLIGREPLTSVPPVQAILLGLARGSLALERHETASQPDALTASVGLELPGGRFRPLIHGGTQLPATLTRQFPTTRAGQTEVAFQIYQGDGEVVRLCTRLGVLKVDGLPKRPRGALNVDLRMKLDRDGVLRASLTEPISGQAGHIEVATQQASLETRRAVSSRNPGTSSDRAPSEKKGFFRRWFGG